jgi:hypothetical protein
VRAKSRSVRAAGDGPPPQARNRPSVGARIQTAHPQDIAARIEAKAQAEGRPQNRVVINELAAIPYLERVGKLDELVRDMEVVLARHGARIAWHDLADELLQAVDAVLEA